MSDLFPVEPKEPPSTTYSRAFERCWKIHPVGTKKRAWEAGNKAGWTDANWLWLTNYLERRWKDDQKWVNGAPDGRTGEMKKYIPHLSSIINGERWHDNYQKIVQVSRDRNTIINESPDEAFKKLTPEMQQAVLEARKGATH